MKIKPMMRDTGKNFPVLIVSCLFLLFLISCRKDLRSDEAEITTASSRLSSKVKQIALEQVASNLISPIGVVAVPDNTSRLMIIDQIGKIWITDDEGNQLTTPFLDISSKLVTLQAGFDERGLLGLAFHPRYKQNGKFYIYYNAPPRAGGPTPTTSWNNLEVFAEFKVSSWDPNIADPASERIFLQLDDPQFNHNGGTLVFGPDGYLYISIGDGGAANDVGAGHVTDWYTVNAGGNGQDIDSNLFGNILRLDIDGMLPYGIPPDNPFVNKPGRDEIFAYGFRNPYRMSFDMGGSHKLFVGDVGQLLYEEVDVVVKGGNYGWNVKEATHCFSTATPLSPLSSCPSVDVLGNPLIDPVIEMNNFRNPAGGFITASVIGGHVYRGNSIPGFQGKYIFGSISQTPSPATGELFIANPAGPGLWPIQELSIEGYTAGHIGQYIKGMGQDNDGEIYVATSTVLGPAGTTGKVYKIVPAE